MRQVSVTELKNRLSEYLRLVKAGETVEITERAVPVATLTRHRPDGVGWGPLDRLIRDGVVTAAETPSGTELIAEPAISTTGDVVAALVAARGDR
jgi:antitoxin (DNA-binding transcriptional repressor) of toxin-antitoxin stability system